MGGDGMKDMGEMREMPTMVGTEPKEEKVYPHTNISSKRLPEIADYDVGDTVELHYVNKITGKHENGDREVEVEMDVMKCGMMNGKKMPEEEEYKGMSEEEKDKSDEKEVMGKH